MLNKILSKAESFKDLKPGWCNGFEIPPDSRTVEFSKKIIKTLYTLILTDIDIFPGDSNSIFIVPMRNDISLDIEVHHEEILSIEAQKGIGSNYKILGFWEDVSYSSFYKMAYFLSANNF